MHDPGERAPDLSRYQRQMLYPELGEAGQRRLQASRVLICGCGALGSVLADTLARAGVGWLRLVDRDFLEQNNLQRQVLFDEEDVRQQLPKAVAAAQRLRRINSGITIEPLVEDLHAGNIRRLCEGVHLLLDGTDNFETRFLLNDASLAWNIPWVYGGCVAAEGQTMTILPGETPCLRCLMSDAPPPGTLPTCDTAGIFAPVVNVIASLQAMEAIKILSGHPEAASRLLTVVELWDNRMRQVRVAGLRDTVDCPACQRQEFPWLEGKRGSHAAVLCGRNAVQLSPAADRPLSLEALAHKLSAAGPVTRNAFLVRVTVEGHLLTVFADGRAIISGTSDEATARTLYARYVGN